MSSSPTDFGSNGPASRDPEDIARAIDETRSEVDETLDALQARLSPGQILDRAMELVRDNGGQFAGNLGRTVRDNPWPVVLTGVGLAWMMAASRSGSASPTSPSRLGGVGQGVSEASERFSGAASAALSESRNRVAAAAEYASTAASDTAHRVSDGLANATSMVRDQTQRMSEGFADLLREQPLLVGAVGIALGAMLGYVLPSTEAENRLVGEATRGGRGGRAEPDEHTQTGSMTQSTNRAEAANTTQATETASSAPMEDSIGPTAAGNQDPAADPGDPGDPGDHEAQAVSDST